MCPWWRCCVLLLTWGPEAVEEFHISLSNLQVCNSNYVLYALGVLDFLNPHFYNNTGLVNWKQRFRICALPCREKDKFAPYDYTTKQKWLQNVVRQTHLKHPHRVLPLCHMVQELTELSSCGQRMMRVWPRELRTLIPGRLDGWDGEGAEVIYLYQVENGGCWECPMGHQPGCLGTRCSLPPLCHILILIPWHLGSSDPQELGKILASWGIKSMINWDNQELTITTQNWLFQEELEDVR